MNQYHKINSIYKRTMDGKKMLFGEFSEPEFEYLKDNLWTCTEKVDGTNIRIMWDSQLEMLRIGGKTDNAQIPARLFEALSSIFTVPKLRRVFPTTDVCLYGEGFGSGIQKGGGNYCSGNSFVLFDVRIGDWWLERATIESIADELDISIVPIVAETTLEGIVAMCRNGFKSQWGDFIAEGIVAKPKIELFSRGGHRIITKLKYKDFNDVKV
jgi:hypothetical protein